MRVLIAFETEKSYGYFATVMVLTVLVFDLFSDRKTLYFQ